MSKKNGIPEKYYYELLDWKDKGSNALILDGAFDTMSLNELKVHQLKALYLIAFEKDMPTK